MRGLVFVALIVGFFLSPAEALPMGPALGDGELTRQFYQLRHGALAWNGDGQAKSHVRQAMAALSRAAGEGLDPDRYRVFLQGEDAAANDASLTTAVLTYMRDMAVGRPELQAVDSDVALPGRS